ncbi:MAG: BlaI/MecI/CopY family transcriptional regulator, partial [Verrucomicrobiales bacterium]|nr:BlaI/MecI/CopY family transcriptional regulator [Verrucomicrobiales bacterium]
AVRTLLQILEEKGHLRRIKDGKEYTYEPTQSRARAGLKAFQHVLETFYEGSIEKALTAHLARNQDLTHEDFERLKQLIDAARQKEN